MNQTQILILDYGSQYTQLLARRIREQAIYTEVISHDLTWNEIQSQYPNVKGLILSGGPASVYSSEAYLLDPEILSSTLPILGICYGFQLLAQLNGGKIETASKQEFGLASLFLTPSESPLMSQVPQVSNVWMSHADYLTILPTDFEVLAHSPEAVAAIGHKSKPWFGLQFHPEVTQTEFGTQVLKNFLFNIVKAEPDWAMNNFIDYQKQKIQEQVGADKVILGLSGGVDSSVAALLINKAIGSQLVCLFVDTGLLRQNEAQEVMHNYEPLGLNVHYIDAKEEFFTALKGIKDPEAKRKIIGRKFIDVFKREAQKIPNVKFLAQGTIYPDVIESAGLGKTAKVIKSHHNVGGLPKELGFTLLEPLKMLFKDEVRLVGKELGLTANLLNRHPFPGPGLGIRVLEEVTPEKVAILQAADAIFREMLTSENLISDSSQAFVVLLPVKSVGVMGDNRTYDYACVLRSVKTIDFMTAEASQLPWNFLANVAQRIINEVPGINRVTYDLTSKPPGTIEWE
ncbi:GMP synthase (glutamine-hydrolysing) [Entomoplasma freundtii]|uniref:GMP synthase [glutamine-hydrolyzing] n=1 Tax=Entomoplasma freundtii TaxID=74700 RepID=A0A2K8NR49_9MOLU|nr:glutamine-hydrolyzing GMP synthase [Entomoplasma freundtii]ATZ16325.1 GMP synthase [Entomoplasma freundtii]TDY56636.1 GMP synthase (glutamine-hydrolysing) [Entomoplasma freundtii]